MSLTETSSTTPPSQEERTIARILTQARPEIPDEIPQAPRRGSVQHQMEEILFDSYRRYFQNAETRRRWNIERDIPWDKTNPNASEATALIVESFSSVEMFLPDYTHKIMEMVRRSRGRAWFQANWGYEESKHSMVLERWLLLSGKRTEKQLADLEASLLGAEWDLPFHTPRQMILYTMIQELATGVNYTNLRRRAEEEGDAALSYTLRWVSADESAHYNFFRRGVKTYLALEPDETIADLKFVFDHFTMPAHALIPEWSKRGAQIEEAGIYGPKVYLAKIRRPVLEDLGISRQQLKDAGLPEEEAEDAADQAEQMAADRAQRVYRRTHFLPAIPLAARTSGANAAT